MVGVISFSNALQLIHAFFILIASLMDVQLIKPFTLERELSCLTKPFSPFACQQIHRGCSSRHWVTSNSSSNF